MRRALSKSRWERPKLDRWARAAAPLGLVSAEPAPAPAPAVAYEHRGEARVLHDAEEVSKAAASRFGGGLTEELDDLAARVRGVRRRHVRGRARGG